MYIYICIHIYIYIYIYDIIYTYMYTCVCIIYTYTCVYIYLYMSIYIYIYIYTHIHKCIYVILDAELVAGGARNLHDCYVGEPSECDQFSAMGCLESVFCFPVRAINNSIIVIILIFSSTV